MKKILCLLFAMILIGSLLIIPISAASDDYGYFIPAGDYIFRDDLKFHDVSFNDTTLLYFRFSFENSDQIFYGLCCYHYESANTGVYPFKMYFMQNDVNTANGQLNVFSHDMTPDVGWIDQSYRRITILDGFRTNDVNLYSFLRTNLTSVSTDYDGTFFGDLFSVFGSTGTWISGAASSLTSIFYSGELTFLGVLSIAALALSVSFLVIGLIQKFLHFRG